MPNIFNITVISEPRTDQCLKVCGPVIKCINNCPLELECTCICPIHVPPMIDRQLLQKFSGNDRVSFRSINSS